MSAGRGFDIPEDPDEQNALFIHPFNSGDGELYDSIYADDAISDLSGAPTGAERTRLFKDFMATGPLLDSLVVEAYTTGATSLLIVDYTLDVSGADGETATLRGTCTDVLTRNADGELTGTGPPLQHCDLRQRAASHPVLQCSCAFVAGLPRSALLCHVRIDPTWPRRGDSRAIVPVGPASASQLTLTAGEPETKTSKVELESRLMPGEHVGAGEELVGRSELRRQAVDLVPAGESQGGPHDRCG